MITITLPELDLTEVYNARVVDARERTSQNGNEMLVVLLRVSDMFNATGYVLFNRRADCIAFARAFGIPISNNRIVFDLDELIDRTVRVRLREGTNGDYIVAKWIPAEEEPVQVATLLEDPFADIHEKEEQKEKKEQR